jgi:hypothetical protein
MNTIAVSGSCYETSSDSLKKEGIPEGASCIIIMSNSICMNGVTVTVVDSECITL